MSMVFGRYAAFFVPLSDRGIRAVAVTAILGISFLSYLGVRRSSLVQTVFTAGKVLAVLLIVVVGFSVGSRLPAHFQEGTMTADASWRFSPARPRGGRHCDTPCRSTGISGKCS